MTLTQRISETLRAARENSLLRHLRTVERSEECRLMVDGRQLIDFSSSDYLSLAYDDEVLAHIEKTIADQGLGTVSSPLITGHTGHHEMLEKKLAEIFHHQSSMVFPSGWQTNVTLIPTIFGVNDIILSDERNHASLIDGARLSRARVIIHAHRDYDDLDRKLVEVKAATDERALVGIISDTVFSIEGDAADVERLVALKKKHHAVLILDAAHGLPAIGSESESLLGFDNFLNAADAITTSLGKYFTAGGGMVACSERLMELLVNRARGYIYSGSLSPLLIAALLTVISRIEADPTLVLSLKENIEYLRANLADLRLLKRTGELESPVCAIPVEHSKALEAGKKLVEMGLLITPIRYPSVPQGTAILRVSIMRGHTREMLDELLAALAKLAEEGYILRSRQES